jgi:hypothetical protein
MLGGTTRAPDEVVAVVPPDLVPCTVEKVAVNAVLAGCRPEYLPVVLAALAAVCTDRFNIHGVQATTMGATPTLVVNGPIRQRIGMNSGTGALGVGNRANATIGRALQLVIRNVGGSRRGTDRSTYGHPGKLGFCFAEQEEGSPFPPLSAAFGIEPGRDAVTAFASEGPRLIVDQISRDADSLLRSFAECLRTVHHPKLGLVFSALLVIGPEHARVLSEGGLGRDEVLARLHELTSRPGATWTRGADGIAEGLPLPAEAAEASIPKFRPGNLQIAHAGGGAGLFSVILGGWLTGPEGSLPVAVEIGS